MKNQYQVVVVGGGIVGASVLYHLTLRGLTDVALLERTELTAGSSWHAAGGFHAINADTHIAALQKYTISMYPKVQEESGQNVGLKMSGGLELAGTPERWEWLQYELAWHRTMETDARLVTPEEAVSMCSLIDPTGLYGALYVPDEGELDPHGATHAYAIAARKRGADVVLHNRVLGLTRKPSGEWLVETEQGDITAEHVVNAAGLWARKVGHMVGVDHPIVTMKHHYLVTEEVPEVAAMEGGMPSVTDLEGYTYMQREKNGVVLGFYERNPAHWKVEGPDWDFGMTLLPEELDRISPEVELGFARFPALQNVGIRRWVHGGIAFTPDGNPLVGPVPGVDRYWAACGVMAGFSQCAAVGLALANWIVDGDPGDDVYGMDVARLGPWASNDRYLCDTTSQFYARRFVVAYPNEQLPAGRPLKTTPCYDALQAEGARFGATWGLEVPLFYAPGQPDFEENPTLRRSNAHPLVAQEVDAVRTAAGAYETAIYARYEVSGPGAEAWLDHVLACRIPDVGRVRLAPMLNEAGKLMGDLSVTRLGAERFWLTGSYYLQEWHQRWFRGLLPDTGVVLRNITDQWMGFAVSGPASRQIVSRLTSTDMSHEAFPFLTAREMDIGSARAVVGRLSLTGELGFELTVPAAQHRSLWHELRDAGSDLGLRPVGDYAIDSLRLEKGYGIWSTEFTQAYTPGMSGLDRFVAFDKGDFVGRDAALREREQGPEQRLVLLEIDSEDADATGFEPVWHDGRLVGFLTSGAYGHHVGKSLALAYVNRAVADDRAPLTAHIVGAETTARILPEVPYDPKGERIRS